MAALRTRLHSLVPLALVASLSPIAACHKSGAPSPSASSASSAKSDHSDGKAVAQANPKPGDPQDGKAIHAAGHDDHKQPTVLRRCFSDDTALSPHRSIDELVHRAADRLEQAAQQQRVCQDKDGPQSPERLYQEALACAEESLRQNEASVEAHHNRALALLGLGQKDEAKQAITHALAIDPDDPETLLGAAELYIHQLAPTSDNTLIGLAYVRHAKVVLRRSRSTDLHKKRPLSALPSLPRSTSPRSPGGPSHSDRPQRQAVKASDDRALLSRLLLLEGQALSDLGRAAQALTPLEEAIALSDSDQARYERGLVLFDLCRFKDAQRTFAELTRRVPDDAWSHHQLGLVLEMLGEAQAAEKELATARKLAPIDFPEPLPVSMTEFSSLVDKEIRALPVGLRSDLKLVRLELSELPDVSDLTADQPTLSPTIVGLFRGLPLGMPDSEPRSIVLYRKNLLRIVTTRDELSAQVRTTLMHELGHLRGEDDDELRARGLE